MPKKKTKIKKALNPSERLIKEKGKKYVKAIKDYWNEQIKLQDFCNDTISHLSEKSTDYEIFPRQTSGLIWLLKDGVVFVRYKVKNSKPVIETRILDIKLRYWLDNIWSIPSNDGEISLANMFKGSEFKKSITIQNSVFGGKKVEYVNLSYGKYSDSKIKPTLSKALIDFKLTFLGLILESTDNILLEPIVDRQVDQDTVITKLKAKVLEFKGLLYNQVAEETLQRFLMENPFLLRPSSMIIPKKKLGEDFITDFVLLNILDQGPVYTLVEIEKSSHRILTKEKLLAEPVNKAIKQTRDWDVWLEKNKAYLQNKLHGFETPQYLIIIGRTVSFSEDEKTYLRSYNREYKNLLILSYDDLLKQSEEFIDSIEQDIAPNNAIHSDGQGLDV